eukprot:scaffold30.g4437.t1
MTALTVDELKTELRSLSQRRAALEAEIAARTARLEAAGVGMQVPLVDAQGYPRGDMDVAAIRTDRHQVIVLSNDHKALTSRMDALLHQLHAQSHDAGASSSARANGAAPPAPAPAAPAATPVPAAGRPFAVVDEVAPDSPASAAGIRLGDQLCSFGAAAAASAPAPLQAVAAELQANVGRSVRAVFLRAGEPVQLELTPRQWGGRGLLGCHLSPL